MKGKLMLLILISSLVLNLAFISTWAFNYFYDSTFANSNQQSKSAGEQETWSPLHKKLGVSEEQWEKIEPKMKEFREKIRKQRSKMQDLRLGMLDILSASRVDKEAMQKQQEKIFRAKRSMQDIVLNHILQEKKLLTENQTKEMFNMLRNRMGHQGSKKPIGTNATKERCPGAAGILGNIRE